MKVKVRGHYQVSHVVLIPALFGVTLLIASCATTPKPAPVNPAPAAQPAKEPAPQKAPSPQIPAPTNQLETAKNLKKQIDEYGLGPLAPEAYKKGSDELDAGEKAIGTDNAEATTKLEAAVTDFKSVLSTGFPLAVKKEGQVVAEAKSAADALKADRATPDLYKKALDLQQEADAKEKSGAYPEAISLLKQAVSDYQQAASTAKQERASAEAALKQADAQISQTKSQVQTIQQNLESSLAHNGSSSGEAGR